MKELLALPWQIQVVIVGGYFSYVVAYSGRRTAHKSFDTLAIILCFGGIALLSFNSMERLIPKTILVGKVDVSFLREFLIAGNALLVSIASAIVWRRFLGDRVGHMLRKASTSEDDGLYYGWETLIQQPNLEYNQLNVSLSDGRVLESYPLSRFDNLPNGPCILGGDGSIALYVTHVEYKNGERRETKNLNCGVEGARMTFIPSAQIVEVDLRRKSVAKNAKRRRFAICCRR